MKNSKTGRPTKKVVGGKDYLIRNISPELWDKFEKRAAALGYTSGQWNDLMIKVLEKWCKGVELAEKGAVVELVNFDPALARRVVNYQRYYNVPVITLVMDGIKRVLDSAERQWRVKL